MEERRGQGRGGEESREEDRGEEGRGGEQKKVEEFRGEERRGEERRGEKRGREKIPLSAPMSFLSPPLHALATRGYTCVQPQLVVHALNGRFSSYLP